MQNTSGCHVLYIYGVRHEDIVGPLLRWGLRGGAFDIHCFYDQKKKQEMCLWYLHVAFYGGWERLSLESMLNCYLVLSLNETH